MHDFLSIRGAAGALGVHYSTVYRWIHDGKLPAAKIGRIYRIKREDLLAYSKARKSALQGQSAQRAVDPDSTIQEQPDAH